MPLEPGQAVRLARALRDLREAEWPEVELTQAQLAQALSGQNRVAPATLSSWESLSNPKTPSASRLSAYARFFATRRSLEGGPHLIAENKLTPDERERCHELEEHLLSLLQVSSAERRNTFSFDEGPITIICPEAPETARGPLADTRNPNFNRFQQFADLDALVEMWGHVRAVNPGLESRIRLPGQVVPDDVSGHVILLGGIGWNQVTRRFQTAIGQVPITQVEVPGLDTGEIFTVKEPKKEETQEAKATKEKSETVAEFFPEWEEFPETGRVLIEDVALLARLRNPFQISRTLTICNGIHSRGVLGAVRCLTDRMTRDANERYLAERFHDGIFAMLLRVPVLANESLSPDLQNPDHRLFEWSPPKDGARR